MDGSGREPTTDEQMTASFFDCALFAVTEDGEPMGAYFKTLDAAEKTAAELEATWEGKRIFEVELLGG